jgi:hypothetical protein
MRRVIQALLVVPGPVPGIHVGKLPTAGETTVSRPDADIPDKPDHGDRVNE